MFWSSHVGKKRVCDRLVAALALAGDERVLDAGCGSRLALIGCAKKLDAGKAVGVDLWAIKDLSDNSCAAPLTNAAIEGVAERVEVETGDITNLQFPDASFDAVISMTVLHNIASREGRDRALHELARVLKPGGRLAIFDASLFGCFAQGWPHCAGDYTRSPLASLQPIIASAKASQIT